MNKKKRVMLALTAGIFSLSSTACSSQLRNEEYIRALERIVISNDGTLHDNKGIHIQGKLTRPKSRPTTFLEEVWKTETKCISVEIHKPSDTCPTHTIVVLPTLGEPVESIRIFSKTLAGYGNRVVAVDVQRELFKQGAGIREVLPTIEMVISKIHHEFEGSLACLGSSTGGNILMDYALSDYPSIKYIDAYAIHASYLPFATDLARQMNPRIGLAQGCISRKIIKALKPRLTLKDILLDPKKRYNGTELEHSIDENPGYTKDFDTGTYFEYVNFTPKRSLSELNRPLLIIAGNNDRLVPKEHLAKLWDRFQSQREAPTEIYIVHNRFGEFRDAPHMGLDTNPEEISAVIHHYVGEIKKRTTPP
ncbi:MAG: alpha/beta hydrolase [Nanoarchaeota archaeon]|nr:alpha/beta hydrolase [Nanoarchaeota archaeon]MBU1050999.1 alpha/beta hydrolase [Nanoarchaeota archaeon]MBU1988334.1 alpha/beta hydrolase [Nanoarchaeota archaeon]